jgi:hypothetical protein
MDGKTLVYLYFILVIALIIIAYIYTTKKSNLRQQNQNVLFETILYHLGGHPYLQANTIVFFQIRNNKTIYFHKENVDTGKEIPISNLLKYEVKTESQIRHDATITRLLTLGIFAFGAKKKFETNTEYLILSYIDNGIEVTCVFKQMQDKQELGTIISDINRLKIENNNNKECANS